MHVNCAQGSRLDDGQAGTYGSSVGLVPRNAVAAANAVIFAGRARIVGNAEVIGILLGMLGSALQRGAMRCFLGVLICGLSYWLKSRAEERFMAQRFGDEYLEYCHKLKALAPFIF